MKIQSAFEDIDKNYRLEALFLRFPSDEVKVQYSFNVRIVSHATHYFLSQRALKDLIEDRWNSRQNEIGLTSQHNYGIAISL
jgi:hypothetical protein